MHPSIQCSIPIALKSLQSVLSTDSHDTGSTGLRKRVPGFQKSHRGGTRQQIWLIYSSFENRKV